MKTHIDKCPYCGSEIGFFTTSHFLGTSRTLFNFQGAMYTEKVEMDIENDSYERMVRCIDCKKPLFKKSDAPFLESDTPFPFSDGWCSLTSTTRERDYTSMELAARIVVIIGLLIMLFCFAIIVRTT